MALSRYSHAQQNGIGRRDDSQEGRRGEQGEVEEAVIDAVVAGARLRRRSSASVTKHPSTSKTPKQKKSKKKPSAQQLAAATQEGSITRQPMLASRPLPLLVCSIGNPGSTYADTLHSAGHTVLNRLVERLGYSGFRKDRSHGNGLLSEPPSSGGSGDWTLWQSTSYMNESGKGVRGAYMTWSKSITEEEGRLVVVHDELEKPLGAVSLKTNRTASAKGHNGLKSIMGIMGQTPFARIGVGIGRPVSREPDDVARYVLKKMTPAEKMAIEASVEQIIKKLRLLETGGG